MGLVMYLLWQKELYWRWIRGAQLLISVWEAIIERNLKAAVDYAESKGVILVAAAETTVFLVSFPARYDSVIGVTALSPDGRVADFPILVMVLICSTCGWNRRHGI